MDSEGYGEEHNIIVQQTLEAASTYKFVKYLEMILQDSDTEARRLTSYVRRRWRAFSRVSGE